jgi:DNA helicase-2/ATP-dependent DNA helicase PcrA
MSVHDLLDKLNPQQLAAVTTTDGPLLVIAGAGSGKTRVITHRIAYLIREKGVPAWQIFAATFTNKAAEEMRVRIGRLVPGADTARLSISTFHSLCVGILRREAQHVGLTSRFTICDDSDQLALIKDCIRNLEVPLKADQIRNYIGTAKTLMLGPQAANEQLGFDLGPGAAQVYKQYQDRLLANDAVDFDDLLLHVVKIFKEHPDVLEHYHDRWRYILVDEYQDTNRVQFEFVQLLAGKHGNICAVGDEDQSIYSWRGAEIENLLNFPKLFEGTQIIRLEQNYRSTETILQAASAVIANNTQRLGKELWSERGVGDPITLIVGQTERDEAAQVIQTIVWLRKLFGIRLNDVAIFYRVNALSRVYEDQLRQRGLAYRVIGGIKFYERAEIKDLLCYLRLCINPRDGMALGRVINKPTRGIGDKTLSKLYNDAVRDGVSVWDVLREAAAGKVDGISKRTLGGIREFIGFVREWGEFAKNHEPQEVLRRILLDTQYEAWLGDARDLETISRKENIAELVSAVDEYQRANSGSTLDDYLERVALVSATDELSAEDAVSLMSLHTAKGLEYPAVFMIGMEEPIFPSQRAVAEGNYEEERRLFYVGITRARDWLFLSRADSRNLYGRPAYNMPSQFLTEVPPTLLRAWDETLHAWSDRSGTRLTATPSTPQSRSAYGSSGGQDDLRRRLGTMNRTASQHHTNDDVPEIQLQEKFAPEPSAQPRPTPAAPTHSAQAVIPTPQSNLDFEPENEGLFPIGTRVVHTKLGAGEVIASSGSGPRCKVTVRFDAGLELEILEHFGGLSIEATAGELPF